MRATKLPHRRSSTADAATPCSLALALAMLCFAWPGTAQAYLDPLTGSVLIQALVGTVLGAMFAAKVYWRKIKAYFTGRPLEDADSSPEGAPAEDER